MRSMNIWSFLLEIVRFRVASLTTRTVGKKKTYEIYRFMGPSRIVSNIEKDQNRIGREFMKLYNGGINPTRIRGSSCYYYSVNQCRVYAVHQSNPAAPGGGGTLWVQMIISTSLDRMDHPMQGNLKGNTNIHRDTILIAVIPPESAIIALTAGRAPSRCRFTKFFMMALETVLTCSEGNGYMTEGSSFSSKLERLSGTEPYDLLHAAQSIENGIAMGRFSTLASMGSTIDPISDLKLAATTHKKLCNDKTDPKKGLKDDATYTDDMKALPCTIDVQTGKYHDVILFDHTAHEQACRKRKRDEEFGLAEHCPRRECIEWEWDGKSTAASACWLSDMKYAQDNEMDLPSYNLKCTVTMKGSDVFRGMRTLIGLGYMEAPLPSYIRDAPLYTNGAIHVVDHDDICSTRNR